MPPKVYEAAHEKTAEGGFQGHLMGEHEKGVNLALAEHLFHQCLKDSPGKVLDIGSKYPYLAHCFKTFGCDAFGMDNLEIVPDYAQALGVPMLLADFERCSQSQIQQWSRGKRFQLITMVHVFEHMYDPLEALRKLRRLLADDGRLFLRLPDHKVPGYERDLSPGHFTIHPFYHCLDSLLELLVQGSNLFAIEATSAMSGSGQRDLILRPLTQKPSIHAFLITKN